LQLIEILRYIQEGRWFGVLWGHWPWGRISL